MARVKGIISAGLSSASRGELATSLDASAPATNARPVSTDHVPLLEQIRARSDRISRAQSTAPNAELAAQSGLAGLGAAAVFGPAGLLVGGLVQMLGRRRLSNMRELATQDAESTTAAVERARSSLTAAREGAETDAERAEVDMHIDQFEQLEALTAHPDANVRSQALIKMLDLSGSLDTELEEVEARQREAQARERERFEYEVGRADDVRGELVSEYGKDFATRIDAYRSILAVEDTSMGDQTLIIRAAKINDPTSAVLPGEAATVQNLAGVPDVLITAFNRVFRDGERLQPEERADIIRQAGLIVGEARNAVIDANTSAAERLRDQGVRDELIGSTLIPIPNADELPLPRGSTRLGASDRAALEGPAPERAADGETLETQPAASLFGESEEDVGGVGRVLQLVTDSFGVQRGPDVRNLGVLPERIQAEVDKFPPDWEVYYDPQSGDLLRQGGVRGGGLQRLGLSDVARNSIRATMPPMDRLEEIFERRRNRNPGTARGVIDRSGQRASNAD